MTFSKNYGSVFVETTWLIYREKHFSEFKWNSYLTTKKFALTEMAIQWSHFHIMALADRLPENGVLVGLAIYEYIDPRQGAVRCGNENPIRVFKNSRKI